MQILAQTTDADQAVELRYIADDAFFRHFQRSFQDVANAETGEGCNITRCVFADELKIGRTQFLRQGINQMQVIKDGLFRTVDKLDHIAKLYQGIQLLKADVGIGCAGCALWCAGSRLDKPLRMVEVSAQSSGAQGQFAGNFRAPGQARQHSQRITSQWQRHPLSAVSESASHLIQQSVAAALRPVQ
ncbi:hypothetical protein D3C85_1228170 [compost metagenome]